jgi:hypothetical protein
MKPRIAVPLLLLASLALLSGCGSGGGGNIAGSGQPDTRTELQRAEVARVLAQTPEVIEDLEFESPSFTDTDLSAGAALTSRHSLRWWRTIKKVNRFVEYAFADSDTTGQPQSAIVTITKDLTGTFHVQNGNGPRRPGDGMLASLRGDDDDDEEDGEDESCDSTKTKKYFEKALEDHWVRRIALRRVYAEDDTVGRWKVVATSAVEVTSEGHTIDIESVHIASANLDTTLTAPLDLWRLRRLLVFAPREVVEITVTTNGDSSDVVSTLCRGPRGIFKSVGGGVFTARWKAPNHSDIGHFGVNALTRETLFDPKGPYDSAAWILPYVVRGYSCGDYLPR